MYPHTKKGVFVHVHIQIITQDSQTYRMQKLQFGVFRGM